jgi:hypothetical protein
MTRTTRAPAIPAEELRAISDELRAVGGELAALRRLRDRLADARLAALDRDAPATELRGLKAADRLAGSDLDRAHRRYRRLLARWAEVLHGVYPDSPIGAPQPAPATPAA